MQKVPSESHEQRILKAWLAAALPPFSWTATANGFLRTKAQRIAAQQQGVLFGVPDILIFVHPPCWIELKKKVDSVTQANQTAIHARFAKLGYEGIVANGEQEAVAWLKARYNIK